MPPSSEARARLAGGFLLLLLGAWILHSFLGFLVWAVVLALTTWPAFQRLADARGEGLVPALGLTLSIGLVILAPLGYGLTRLIAEAQSLGQVLAEAQRAGLPAPDWLAALPMIGAWAANAWSEALGTPEAAKETFHLLETGSAIAYLKSFASQVFHRLAGFFITLLALFFLYRHGIGLSAQVLNASRRMFGESGTRYAAHAATAVRATVNGLVLVGLGEGLLLGVGYAVAGLSHPALLGAITGVLAMIPFAAKPVFAGCALVLAAQGHIAAGAGLFAFGLAVILLADNYIRPSLIGGAVKLPFLWTLLGILGGLENFGLLGLFLGPTVMAVLMSIWRDCQEEPEMERE
jgi:predicted PurR-regulated permease PerM